MVEMGRLPCCGKDVTIDLFRSRSERSFGLA